MVKSEYHISTIYEDYIKWHKYDIVNHYLMNHMYIMIQIKFSIPFA